MVCVFFFKQKTAYEMRISDWSSDVCSSDLEVDVERTLSNAGLGGDGADRGFGKAAPADLALGGIEYLAAGDFAAAGFRQRQGAFPRVHARHESVVILVSPIRPPAVKRQEAGKRLYGPFWRRLERNGVGGGKRG